MLKLLGVVGLGVAVAMLEFDDVVKCKDTEEFNLFVRQYLEERNIAVPSERARRLYWALFYRWIGK